MLIVCPSCATSYEVQPTALGAAGRSVRCVRCRTQWFATPPGVSAPVATPPPVLEQVDASDAAVAAFRAELAGEIDVSAAGEAPAREGSAGAAVPPIDESAGPGLDDLMAAGEPAAETPAIPEDEASIVPADDPPAEGVDAPSPDPDFAETPVSVADAPALAPMQADQQTLPGDAPTLQNEPVNIESFAARRAKRAPKRGRRMSVPGLPMLILGLIAVIAALLSWRNGVVRHAPQMASLYAAIGLPVNLRGLAFTDVKTVRDAHDGVPVLVVEGTIVNTTKAAVDVPRLRFAVRNEGGNEAYAWTALPAQPVLAAGESLPFRSRLASPPNGGREVLVRFFTRRDAVAGVN